MMVDHTIEAHFEIKASASVAERSARIDARAIALLAEVIGGDEQLAAAIYRGVMALPVVLKQALKDEGG